jgi:hypothetical protein
VKEQQSDREQESQKSKGVKEQRSQRAKESKSKGVKEQRSQRACFRESKKLYKVHAYLSCKRLKVDKSNKNFFAIHDYYFGGIALTMVNGIKKFTAVIYEFL